MARPSIDSEPDLVSLLQPNTSKKRKKKPNFLKRVSSAAKRFFHTIWHGVPGGGKSTKPAQKALDKSTSHGKDTTHTSNPTANHDRSFSPFSRRHKDSTTDDLADFTRRRIRTERYVQEQLDRIKAGQSSNTLVAEDPYKDENQIVEAWSPYQP